MYSGEPFTLWEWLKIQRPLSVALPSLAGHQQGPHHEKSLSSTRMVSSPLITQYVEGLGPATANSSGMPACRASRGKCFNHWCSPGQAPGWPGWLQAPREGCEQNKAPPLLTWDLLTRGPRVAGPPVSQVASADHHLQSSRRAGPRRHARRDRCARRQLACPARPARQRHVQAVVGWRGGRRCKPLWPARHLEEGDLHARGHAQPVGPRARGLPAREGAAPARRTRAVLPWLARAHLALVSTPDPRGVPRRQGILPSPQGLELRRVDRINVVVAHLRAVGGGPAAGVRPALAISCHEPCHVPRAAPRQLQRLTKGATRPLLEKLAPGKHCSGMGWLSWVKTWGATPLQLPGTTDFTSSSLTR